MLAFRQISSFIWRSKHMSKRKPMASQAVCTEDINRINKIWHIIQIHKVQILLFCYIDNYIFLCYSLLVSRFFSISNF